jgi:hypothetical protein
MGLRKVDWIAAKTEYVTQRTSYKRLAKKYGVSMTAIAKHAKEERWVQAREDYINRTVKKAVAKLETQEVDKLARIMSAADKMAGIVDDLSGRSELFTSRVAVMKDDGEPLLGDDGKPVMDTTVNARDIRDFTTALKDLTATIRNLYNLPTKAQAEAQRINTERWEAEKRRMEAESSTDNNRIEVVIAGGLEDYTV